MKATRLIRSHWPFIAATLVLYATIAAIALLAIRQNGGHFSYAYDDPYIHMAIAKNFALHSVWGVTQYGFSSSTSSLLWPALLSAVYALFGVSELGPFIINIVLATLLIWLVCILLRRQGLSPLLTFVTALALIFFTPLPTMIFAGMEHILHALLTIGFVYLSALILTSKNASLWQFALWLVLGAMMTATRYEGLAVILVALVLLLVRKRYWYSLALAVISAAPLVTYGIISLTKGWYFLPNSALLKGVFATLSVGGIGGLFADIASFVLKNPYIIAAVLTALLLLIIQVRKQNNLWKVSSVILVFFIATAILYILFSRISWFFRHDAYIAALGVFALAIAAVEQWPRRLSTRPSLSLTLKYVALALLIATAVLFINGRAIPSLTKTPRATTNIYQQQYQMGLFLRQFYQGKVVAANDIGAINYLADIRCLDLAAIGSMEVTKAELGRYYTTEEIYRLGREKGVEIAIVYDRWFQGARKIPAQWSLAGIWVIPNNVVCGDNMVSFYAVMPGAESELIKNLSRFSPQLPADVQEYGKYIMSRKE
jgi:hypothetical protein